MSRSASRIRVLKIGGSVLDGAAGYRAAAAEIARQRANRVGILAVVSARNGATESLLASAHELAPAPSPDALSGLLATGETASAFLLALALDGLGLHAEVLTVADLDLRTRGPRLDAVPVAVDRARLRRTLRRSVAIAPGFVGRDARRRPTLLGRGGSDLTSLFLAHELAAECTLVKDVDGLYERDPAAVGSGCPRRYARAAWDDVERLGNGLVQPKALRFARRRQMTFRIAALGGRGTRVGSGPAVLETARCA